ncbi:trypsin-like peptidase domain-containing protein [Paracoccaceae bacterium]|nr:trypsin-like peptidase domain-containing protein [Paracoccaceae bacterium]
MTLSRLIISTALAVLSLVSAAQGQEVLYLDRSSFGKAVLSQTESTVNDSGLESAMGSYQNEPISNYREGSVFSKLGMSVGRLDVLSDRGISTCTAFIVSDRHIITNHHCTDLSYLTGATRIDAIQFVAGYTKTGVEEITSKYTVIPTPVETSKKLDYAVMEVIGDPSKQYGELKLASLTPQDGDPFWIIGHPKGEGQRISREKCRASSPAVSAGKLRHTCDTLPGNSGSPVIDAGLQQVVALHHMGSKKDSVNYAIPMSEILKNSAVLAAYKAPDEVLKSQPVEPKTAANSACDALYSATAETKECYAYDAYLKSCADHALAPLARGYINEFCQPKETVKVDKVPEKTCDDDPSLCSDKEICTGATTSNNGAVKRDWNYFNIDFVSEANLRGLTCGVTDVVAKSAIKTEVIFAKTHFKQLDRTQRKQLQYGLKQLGYYSSSIDGLWGKGTNAGVNSFAKDRNLSSNFPKSVFDALASEVAFENMPVSEPVMDVRLHERPKRYLLNVKCNGKVRDHWVEFYSLTNSGYSFTIHNKGRGYYGLSAGLTGHWRFSGLVSVNNNQIKFSASNYATKYSKYYDYKAAFNINSSYTVSNDGKSYSGLDAAGCQVDAELKG